MKTITRKRGPDFAAKPLLCAILLFLVLGGLGCFDESDDDASDDDSSGVTCTTKEFCAYHAACKVERYDWITRADSESLCLEDEWWRLEGEDARCPYVPYMTCLCACMDQNCSDYDNLQDLCRSNCDRDYCEEQTAIPTTHAQHGTEVLSETVR